MDNDEKPREKQILWKIHSCFMNHQETGHVLINFVAYFSAMIAFALMFWFPLFNFVVLCVWLVSTFVYICLAMRGLQQKRKHYREIKES